MRQVGHRPADSCVLRPEGALCATAHEQRRFPSRMSTIEVTRALRPAAAEHVPVALDDKYANGSGRALMSGIHALVRLLLEQRRLDARRGLDTGVFISGYEGSPLGGLDQELVRASDHLDPLGVVFRPGLNEELAATAVSGTQLLGELPEHEHDGIVGFWYGKNPGLDRAADAIRHGNVAGTAPLGGAVALIGDDPAAKSSTLPSACEPLCRSLLMPVLAPSTVREIVVLGLHAVALSRESGLLGRAEDRHRARRRDGDRRRRRAGDRRARSERPRRRPAAGAARSGIARRRAGRDDRAPGTRAQLRPPDRPQPRRVRAGAPEDRDRRRRCRLHRIAERARGPRVRPGRPRRRRTAAREARHAVAARARERARAAARRRAGARRRGQASVRRIADQGGALPLPGRPAGHGQGGRRGAQPAARARHARRRRRRARRGPRARRRRAARRRTRADAHARSGRGRCRRGARDAAEPDAVLLLRLPAQRLDQGGRRPARRGGHRLPHHGRARYGRARAPARHAADGRRGRTVARARAVRQGQALRPEPRRRHLPPLRLAGDPRRRRRGRRHDLQAALQRRRRDDRRSARGRPHGRAVDHAPAGGRGRAADHRDHRRPRLVQGCRARSDRAGPPPRRAAARPAGARRDPRGHGPDPRRSLRGAGAAPAQARQAAHPGSARRSSTSASARAAATAASSRPACPSCRSRRRSGARRRSTRAPATRTSPA